MGTTVLQPARRLFNIEFGARKSIAILLLVLVTVGLYSTLRAYEKPFWYDEICTVILCRLPGASDVWKALDHAADTNPPLFYMAARCARQLIPDDHMAYRLPSILGLLATVFCVYFIQSRRVDRISALVGATFVLCTPLADFASEARPYSLMVGCIAAAILAWQRIEDSKLYCLLLAITLAAAVSLHYYAILAWPAFVLAEASIWACKRRFRGGAWLALVLGLGPLLCFSGLLLHLRQYYGQHFWARPGLGQIFSTSNYLFNLLGYWGWSLTIGTIAILIYWSFVKGATSASAGQREIRERPLPIAECALIVVLLLLPVVAVAAAKVSGGGMTTRYMLPAILGGALAVAYLTSKAPGAMRALLLALMLVNYALSSTAVLMKASHGSLLGRRTAASGGVKAILSGQHESKLPIVISSGLDYLPMAYYTPAGAKRELYALADPQAAVAFAKTDSVDRALLILRQYFPLQVEEYSGFASRHREFILVSKGGGEFDWWPSRLSHDGHILTLVSANGNTQVYRVILRP